MGTERQNINGEAWLRSLDPSKRPEAKIWMEMAPDEFQGRMALALADIREELDDLHQSQWKQAAKGAGLIIGGVGAGIAAWVRSPWG